MMANILSARESVAWGGEWLGTARRWMQSNVKGGDTLTWGSNETVHIPFYKLEELAHEVAVAAIEEDRKRRSDATV
jgi:hypothetical protein